MNVARFVARSRLLGSVQEGLQGLEKAHRQLIHQDIRKDFADSLALDDALRPGNEQANRWDYLLGHEGSAMVIGLEPHSANTSEVSTVIATKNAARGQLRDHPKPGNTVAAWFWVASGRVDFAPHDKIITRLEQEGIAFVGGTLRSKDIETLRPSKKRKR